MSTPLLGGIGGSPTLNVDPGATNGGAAIMLPDHEAADPRNAKPTPLAWLAYVWLKRESGPGIRHRPGRSQRGVYRVRLDGGAARPPAQLEVPSLWDVAHLIRELAEAHRASALTLEMPFGGKRQGSRKSDPGDTIVLAESAGVLLAVLAPSIHLVSRPLASEWRAPYGWAALGADDAEGAACEAARRKWRWGVDGACRLAPYLALDHVEQGAVAEAGWMAEMPWPEPKTKARRTA
jgi:hypothetical protein